MLSLKEFKKFKIDENTDVLSMIKGGITCEGVMEVLEYLYANGKEEQAHVVEQMAAGSGIYVTDC